MNAKFNLPEALAASTTMPVDERNGLVKFTDDFQKLLNDITTEAKASLEFLTDNPDRMPYMMGTVETDSKLESDWLTSDKSLADAMIPQYAENVRMYPIPGTYSVLTDLDATIADHDLAKEFPRTISKYNIPTKAELEQLVVGLRALRD
ncbi:MAG: hypothetical protein JWM07_328 [Candidatus Saccharibacteria bacterium]|nr:hypothetical protein [Candidatus Saccharibacteria bacterium]